MRFSQAGPMLMAAIMTWLAVLPALALGQSSPPLFFFKSYMGRCMDFGPPPQVVGAPVFIFDCNKTVTQQVGVEEFGTIGSIPLASSLAGPVNVQEHQVRLHAGSLCIGAASNPPQAGSGLTLQPCALVPAQLFGLDGDSILFHADRDLVVQLKSGVTENRTPLVLGPRDTSDIELWDTIAVDGSARWPTSGFTTASTLAELQQALATAGVGTVIVISADITFDDLAAPLAIPGGVTVRGDRRGVLLGPQIWLKNGHNSTGGTDDPGLFITAGDRGRITGLRLRGPGRAVDGNKPAVKGINANARFSTIVDHNDLSDWTRAAVDLSGDQADVLDCPTTLPDRPKVVRIFRNFIHDNTQTRTDGYGVVSGSGSNPLIFANVFQKNLHSVASDGFAYSAYAALNNLFLSGNTDTDVDMHGQGQAGSHDFGGIGGLGAQVDQNTFLGTEKTNFGIRGIPCSGALDTFEGNVVVRDVAGAITVVPDGQSSSVSWTTAKPHTPFLRVASQFSVPNPTNFFLVGDFDGDGKDDLFLATGAGWYYSPAANAEWRFLSAKTETADTLLLGDFDGDGRVDVFTQVGDEWLVSWGGRSPWQLLSKNHGIAVNHGIRGMIDFVIADFTGDGRADVFYADGTNWWLSDGGVTPFAYYATSSYRNPDLLFGDFDGDGRMDVAGVVDNQWMFVPGKAPHQWTPLRSALTNTMKGLVAADFNGNGNADIAQFDGLRMRVSRDGRDDWAFLNVLTRGSVVAIGRFDDSPGADILFWNENFLEALSKGTGSPHRQSRQDMR